MSYPRWLPQNLTQWLLCIASGALAFIACTLAMFVGPWCRDVSPTLATLPSVAISLNYAAGQSAFASTQTVNLVGSATSLIGNSTTHKDGTLFGAVYQVGQLVKAGAGTATAATELEKSAKQKIDDADVKAAQEKAGKLIDAYATIPPTINRALEPLPALQRSLTRTSDATAAFVSGPAAALASNGAELANNSAVMTKDVDAKFFAPWDGSHPFRHRAWQVFKIATGLARPVYYGVGIANGQ